MRVVENTPERLLLQDRAFIAAIGFGSFAILFLVMAWFARVDALGISLGLLLIASMLLLGVAVSYRDNRITFSRAGRVVTIDRRSLIRRSSQTVPLDQVRAAVAQAGGYRTRKGNSVVVHGRRPALQLVRKATEIPLARGYGDAAPTEAVVQAMNEWLAAARGARR